MCLASTLAVQPSAPADGDLVFRDEDPAVETAFDDQILGGPEFAGDREALGQGRDAFRQIELGKGARAATVVGAVAHRSRCIHGLLERETGVEPATFSLGS